MIPNIKPRDHVTLVLPNGSLEGYMLDGTVGFYDDWNGQRVVGFYTNDPNALLIPPKFLGDAIRVRPDRRDSLTGVYKLRIFENEIAKMELVTPYLSTRH